MDSIWALFAPMGAWETQVAVQQLLFTDADVSLFVAGSGKTVLWYVDR